MLAQIITIIEINNWSMGRDGESEWVDRWPSSNSEMEVKWQFRGEKSIKPSRQNYLKYVTVFEAYQRETSRKND